jgi:hypothetical protein
MRPRALVWLLAVLALALTPVVGASDAKAAANHAAGASMPECPDHAPPPDCPDEGTAKHASGDCCPLMANAVALLPDAAAAVRPPVDRALLSSVPPGLTGLSPSKDPPPPRA